MDVLRSALGLSLLLSVALLAAALPSRAALAAPGILLAVDADPSGNGPRSVGSIENCVSASVGQPVDIDIVLPSPGIPAERGIAAFQFSLFYDPAVVWVNADAAAGMLLAQAYGSSVLPIQDPKPDKNGLYISWAVDFGRPKGIESEGGPSETGPGVLSRLTLLPQTSAVSALSVRDVVIIDDSSQRFTIGSVEPGAIAVGQPCSGEAATPTSTATPAALTTDTSPASLTQQTPTQTAVAAPPTSAASAVGGSGGTAGGPATGVGALAPAAAGIAAWAAIATGVGGAGLFAGSRLALARQGRRHAPGDQRGRPPHNRRAGH